MLPNIFIAGTNKSGTTSVFRYLSDHPQICASSVKEVQAFSSDESLRKAKDEQLYARLFDSERALGAPYRLEASPQYLAGGRDVARRIAGEVPEVRLIFVLREPVDRLRSRFGSRLAQDDWGIGEGSWDEFARRCAASLTSQSPGDPAIAWEVRHGLYKSNLEQFMQEIPADRIFVTFFDQLEQDPRQMLMEICEFLGVDAETYRDHGLPVHNKSRKYRWATFHRLAHQLNMRFESSLSRYPALKAIGQKLYWATNTVDEGTQEHETRPGEGERLLATAYAQNNRGLGRLLSEQLGVNDVPMWARD